MEQNKENMNYLKGTRTSRAPTFVSSDTVRGTHRWSSSGKSSALKLNDSLIYGFVMYCVASPFFVTQGVDGYIEFRNAVHIEDTGIMIVEIIDEFLSETNEYQPIVENRIIVN